MGRKDDMYKEYELIPESTVGVLGKLRTDLNRQAENDQLGFHRQSQACILGSLTLHAIEMECDPTLAALFNQHP